MSFTIIMFLKMQIMKRNTTTIKDLTEQKLLIALVHEVFTGDLQDQLIIELENRDLGEFINYKKYPISEKQMEIHNSIKEFEINIIFSPDGNETYAVGTDGLVLIENPIVNQINSSSKKITKN